MKLITNLILEKMIITIRGVIQVNQRKYVAMIQNTINSKMIERIEIAMLLTL